MSAPILTSLRADHLHIYTFRFPTGTTRHRVPCKEFYAISAAYGGLDLEAEKSGPAPLVPVFVGGPVTGTLLLDLRRAASSLAPQSPPRLARSGPPPPPRAASN